MNPVVPLSPAEVVAQLRRDLDELKGRQLIGWDSFSIFDTSSGALYDITATLTASQSQSFDITLTYARAKAGAMLELNPFFRVDDGNVMANPAPRPVLNNTDLAIWWTKTGSTATSSSWRLTMMNRSASTTHAGYVKLFFEGTDSGSFNIVPV